VNIATSRFTSGECFVNYSCEGRLSRFLPRFMHRFKVPRHFGGWRSGLVVYVRFGVLRARVKRQRERISPTLFVDRQSSRRKVGSRMSSCGTKVDGERPRHPPRFGGWRSGLVVYVRFGVLRERVERQHERISPTLFVDRQSSRRKRGRECGEGRERGEGNTNVHVGRRSAVSTAVRFGRCGAGSRVKTEGSCSGRSGCRRTTRSRRRGFR
jgi:hypothetical protein